jgi:regulator of replication initiation timing
MQNRQIDIFRRANTIENELNSLLQQINDIKRKKTKIIDSHLNIERKLKQIQDLTSTINVDEKQERVILSQVVNIKSLHKIFLSLDNPSRRK